MISTIQRSRIIDRILQKIFMSGITPRISDIRAQLSRLLTGKQIGLPLFSPRMVAGKEVVNPDVLRDNASEIQEDLGTLSESLVEILESEAITFGAATGEVQELKHRLTKLKEDLDSRLNQEHNQGREVLFDNFRDNSKVDLENTTAFISTTGGYVTLPTNEKETTRFSPSKISLVKETPSSGVKTLGSLFVGVFSDYADKVWQADFPEGGSYIAEVNLTSSGVILGHGNEVEINRVYVDPLAPITISIASSTDGLNWSPLINSMITGPMYFDFPPVWALYLKFTILGNGHTGIRQVSIGKVGTLENATLYSKALTSQKSLYTLLFNTKELVPQGTSISHFFATSAGGPWAPITPGKVHFMETTTTAETFSTEIALDSSTLLYAYPINASNAIIESGELRRGVAQFKVSAFSFDWAQRGDPKHIPQLSDYTENLGHTLSCYMSPSSGATIAPLNIATDANSFIINYCRDDQTWWGVPLISSAGSILKPNYNYRITTYLYSDREMLLSNAGGGVYALGGSFTGTKGIGWALVVNDVRVVYDNSIFVVASIPGSGTLTSSTGRSFPLSLQNGWNKIELLLYVPDDTALGASILAENMVLLLRPNIINFTLRDADNWSYVPKQSQYPIWADGAPMNRVSEFYLKWNVPSLNYDYWAWRISPTSGSPSDVLINYDPTVSSSTIDGRYKGSNEKFQIRYVRDYNPTTSLYYRCDLTRTRGAVQAPMLQSYEFISVT